MDKDSIDLLARGISLFTTSLPVLKQIIDSIPNSQKKKQAKEELARLEEAFKWAQADTAVKLGYHIHQKHWPPVIMLEDKPGVWTCPECGETRDTVGGWIGIG